MALVKFILQLSMLVPLAMSITDIPAIVTIGDSLYDCGNNNNISSPSIAKANHFPYGIDFPVGTFGIPTPTGRFANGKILPDFMASYFKIANALAFKDPNAVGSNLLQGINLASGGAGILDSTSAILTPYNMTVQFQWLDTYIQMLRAYEGTAQANARINKTLVLISLGSNDHSYKSSNNETSGLSDAAFRSLLVDTYEGYIRALYTRGFRRLQISAIGAVGCSPFQITINCVTTLTSPCDRNVCNDNLNQLCAAFNPAMQSRLATLKANLTDIVFFFDSNAYNATYDVFKHPTNYGFQYGNIGCCGNGTAELGDYCQYLSSLCMQNGRDAFVFFDAIHPGTKYTSVLAQALYSTINSTM